MYLFPIIGLQITKAAGVEEDQEEDVGKLELLHY